MKLNHFELSLVCILCLGILGGCVNNINLGPQNYDIEETVVERDEGWGQGYIAVIDVTGMIANYREKGLLTDGENPVDFLRERFKEAEKDRTVKAVILRVQSPGGGVTASELMYQEIKRFKARTKKPVVVLMMDIATSGGYYISCASDHIIAHQGTITGSIGVISQFFSAKELMNKIGIKSHAMTSGPNKASGSPFEELKPEQRQVFRAIVEDMYRQFTAVVKENRTQLDMAHWDQFTDGRIVTAKQALAYGLIDQIGGMNDAWDKAKMLAGIERAHLVYYHRPGVVPASFYAQASMPQASSAKGVSEGLQVNLLQLNMNSLVGVSGVGGFYYLWQPE